jgi:hypothetical protein
MTTSIILILTAAAIFCLLLTTTIVLLTLAAAYLYYSCYYVEPIEMDANANMPPTFSVVPSDVNALPPVLTNTPAADVLLRRKYRASPMPTIPEETMHELLWALHEVPASQQMKPPVTLDTTSNSDYSSDAYMIMSGEPPSMPVIYEETEKDLEWENFRVVPLTGKYRPPAMPVIYEETEKDLEWENFRVVPMTGKHRPPVMPVIPEETDEDIALWAPFELTPASPQQSVLPTAVPCRDTSTSPSSCRTSYLPIMSPVVKITRGVYKGSSCTVVRCTPKMVEVQIFGECQTRRIMQTSLAWV